MRAICNLAVNGAQHEALVEAGIIPRLVRLLDREEEAVQVRSNRWFEVTHTYFQASPRGTPYACKA